MTSGPILLKFPLTGVEVPVEDVPEPGTRIGAPGPPPAARRLPPAALEVPLLQGATDVGPEPDGVTPSMMEDGTPGVLVSAGQTVDGLAAVLFETSDQMGPAVCLHVTGRITGGTSCGPGPISDPRDDDPTVRVGVSVYRWRDDRSSPPVIGGYVATGPLPVGASFVEMSFDGDLVAWQRPRGGVALFPTMVPDGTRVEVVARDPDGHSIGATTVTIAGSGPSGGGW